MIKTTLKILDAEKRLVQIQFSNESQGFSYYLPKPRIGVDRNLDGPYFDFSERVPYIGSVTKRQPYNKDEVVLIRPQEVIESRVIDLNDFYDFESLESDDFEVRYHAFSTLSMDAPYSLTSNWVKFV